MKLNPKNIYMFGEYFQVSDSDSNIECAQTHKKCLFRISSEHEHEHTLFQAGTSGSKFDTTLFSWKCFNLISTLYVYSDSKFSIIVYIVHNLRPYT